MAERPIWRGHLRLALVSCPVALYTTHRERGALHFHLINPATGHRVRTITVDAETEEEVPRSELVHGYEAEKDQYVVLEDEDFENARVESSTTIAIEKFVRRPSIDPIYFESSYYVAPDGDAGADVYAVLRDALAKSGRVALARVVIARRERAVAIMPEDRGIIAHTLRQGREINDPKALFESVPTKKPDPEMIDLAIKLIDRQSGAFTAADMEDRYEARLREVIGAKLKGTGMAPIATEAEDRGNVIDLMAALKKSLSGSASPARAGKAKKRTPAKPVKRPAKPHSRRRA